MSCRCRVLLTAVLIAAAGADPGPARCGAVESLSFTGHVPLTCAASLENTTVPERSGMVDLGLLTETCNAARGYTVYLVASPELSDAKLIIDGRTLRLRGSTPIVIARSAQPGNRQRRMFVQTSVAAGGSVSVRIAPL